MSSDREAVQARIRAGRTTLAAVFAGGDDTPEARRVRELARQDLTQRALVPGPEVRSDLTEAEEEWARLASTAPSR